DVILRRVRIIAPDGPNNDGIVVDSTSHVLIEDCDLHTANDCIALKSGMDEDPPGAVRPTENVVVRRIRGTQGRSGIAIGSEMSGGIRNVLVHDCHFDGPRAGILVKAARGRGGIVEDLSLQDITMGRITGAAIELDTDYTSFILPNGMPPTFRNIRIANVTCADAKTAVRMVGQADHALRSITLENVQVNSGQGLVCAAAQGINLLNVSITPRTG